MSLSQYLIPLVLFIAFASPMAFKSVRGVLGGWVASPEGQAKFLGLLVHGILFVITVGYLMRRVSPYWSHYSYQMKDKSEDEYFKASSGPAVSTSTKINSASF